MFKEEDGYLDAGQGGEDTGNDGEQRPKNGNKPPL